MKRKLLVLLFSLATLALVSCGGSNDVASSGASAVSAAATAPDANTAITQSTATAAKQTNEPKINGQVDERTGVAPVAAQMTIGGSVNYYSQNFGGNSYGVFPINGYYACGFGSTPNQAMVSCLN